MTEKMRHLYDTLINHKNADGFPLIGPFLRRPCEKTYPDYYETIKNPMDMETIDKRIKSNVYKSIEDFSDDINLMFENCKDYNMQLYMQFCDIFLTQMIIKCWGIILFLGITTLLLLTNENYVLFMYNRHR